MSAFSVKIAYLAQSLKLRTTEPIEIHARRGGRVSWRVFGVVVKNVNVYKHAT